MSGIRTARGGSARSTTPAFTRRPFTSSILLWVRDDQPRQQGMDRWKGPHSKIISATPGFEEYRQFHASLILSFPDAEARSAYFAGDAVARLSARLPAFASAVHAYAVEWALTFVAGGKVLPGYRE